MYVTDGEGNTENEKENKKRFPLCERIQNCEAAGSLGLTFHLIINETSLM